MYKSITWIKYIPELFIPPVNIDMCNDLSDRHHAYIVYDDQSIRFNFGVDLFSYDMWNLKIYDNDYVICKQYPLMIGSSKVFQFVLTQLLDGSTNIILPLLLRDK